MKSKKNGFYFFAILKLPQDLKHVLKYTLLTNGKWHEKDKNMLESRYFDRASSFQTNNHQSDIQEFRRETTL